MYIIYYVSNLESATELIYTKIVERYLKSYILTHLHHSEYIVNTVMFKSERTKKGAKLQNYLFIFPYRVSTIKCFFILLVNHRNEVSVKIKRFHLTYI